MGEQGSRRVGEQGWRRATAEVEGATGVDGYADAAVFCVSSVLLPMWLWHRDLRRKPCDRRYAFYAALCSRSACSAAADRVAVGRAERHPGREWTSGPALGVSRSRT